jgi:hypothetical protein
MVTSDAVDKAKVDKGIKVGKDFDTVEMSLTKGCYLLVTNAHPLNTTKGLYFISVTNSINYNRIITFFSDTVITSIIMNGNVLEITSNSYFRGFLIKLTDEPAV